MTKETPKRPYLTKEEREKLHKKRKQKEMFQKILIVGIFLSIVAAGVISVIRVKTGDVSEASFFSAEEVTTEEPIPPLTSAKEAFPDLDITEAYLTPNEYSRPQMPLERVKYIVIHYTANPGTTAESNRNYFEGLKDSGQTHASSHFVIGLDGEILQCIPLNEWCYASNDLNNQAISIEMCHPDASGAFNTPTYNSSVFLVAKLCDYYKIPTENVIRHYHITGKECPKYFVDYPERWEKYLGFVNKWREPLEK